VERKEFLRQWVQDHGRLVIRTAFYYVQDRMIAEDIAQDVFLKAYEHIADFRGTSSVETWLYRITVNQCKDFMKSWSYRKLQVMHTFGFTPLSREGLPEPELLVKDGRQALLTKIMALPLKDREVILLHYFEGMALHDIAALLHDNESTVRARIARARKKLRVSIGEEDRYELLQG